MARAISPAVRERLQLEERFDCWNREEFDLMLEPYAEDAVFDVSPVFTDVSPVRGHADILRQWRDLRETWGGGVRVDPLELLEVDDQHWVLDVRLWGKGTRSGVEIDQRFAFLYTLRPADQKIVRTRLLPDIAAAISEAESSAFGTA